MRVRSVVWDRRPKWPPRCYGCAIRRLPSSADRRLPSMGPGLRAESYSSRGITMTTVPRIPPLNPDDCTPEQKEFLVGWWQELNYVRVLAQHPDLYRAFNPLIEKTISRTKLPP